MQKSTIKPFYLTVPAGRCFAVHFNPVNEVTKRNEGVLIIPPFAEELNISRRIIARQARMLANDGFDVLILDLWGTGDSDGEFVSATWNSWLSNLKQAFFWLSKFSSTIHFLAIRTGALLATDLLSKYSLNIMNLVLWQPIIDGELYIKQFFRLRVAAQAFKGIKETHDDLYQELASNGSLEIAGYELSLALVKGLSQSGLDLNQKNIHFTHIFEIGSSNTAAAKSLTSHSLRTIMSFDGGQYWSNIEAPIGNQMLHATSESLRYR